MTSSAAIAKMSDPIDEVAVRLNMIGNRGSYMVDSLLHRILKFAFDVALKCISSAGQEQGTERLQY